MRQLRQFLHDHAPEESVLTLLMVTAVVLLLGAGMWRLIDGSHTNPKTEVRAAEIRNDAPDSSATISESGSTTNATPGAPTTGAGALSESKSSRSTTTTTKRRAAAIVRSRVAELQRWRGHHSGPRDPDDPTPDAHHDEHDASDGDLHQQHVDDLHHHDRNESADHDPDREAALSRDDPGLTDRRRGLRRC